MGCAGKTLKIMTCGLGPKVRHAVQIKVGFNEWRLKWQIICSVSAFILGLQIIMQAVFQLFFRTLFTSICERMEEKVNFQTKIDFIQQSQSVETSMVTMLFSWELEINKMGDMVNQTMSTDYFDKYPIYYLNQNLTTFEEVSTQE